MAEPVGGTLTETWRDALRSQLEARVGGGPVLLQDQTSWSAEAILALGDAIARRIGSNGAPSCIWVCDTLGAVTLGVLAAFPGLPGTVIAIDSGASQSEAERLAEAATPDLVVTSDGSARMASWAAGRGVPLLIAGADLSARDLPARWAGPARSTGDLGVVTSGTASAARVVELSPVRVVAALSGVRRFGHVQAGDLVLNVSPLHHTLGLITGLLAPVLYGARVVRGSVASLGTAGTISERPTWCALSPAALNLLLAKQPFGDRWAPRVVRLSSAPVPASLAERVTASTDCTLLNAYAMSEAPGEISSAVGVATVGTGTVCEFVVVGEDGLPVPAGDEGEVWIRGANVAREALLMGREQAVQRLVDEGWAPTADRGAVEEGGLVLKGRIGDLINCGGEKVAPEAVEAVLAQHPQVRECVAFPIPHHTLGQAVGVAVVQGASAAAPSDLRRFLLDRLPPSHNPLRILVVAAIPATPRGKRSRSSLAVHFGLGDYRTP